MYVGSFQYIWLIIPVLILSMYAQSKVKNNYNKFAKIRNTSGKTGAEVAREILMRNGLSHVQAVRGQRKLSDHYNPRTETVSLSPEVYDQPSISAASIAAHECGHAVQHATAYGPLNIRSQIAPVVQFASGAASLLTFIGVVLAYRGNIMVLKIAILAYVIVTLFHVITLPVEFNASSRAMVMLADYNMISEEDMDGTKKVLNAAALTYVAAMLASLMTLDRLLLIRGSSRD